MSEPILNIQNLYFSFQTYAGEIQAVRGVSFTVQKGEALGIVGESGCGKSVTAKAIIKLNATTSGLYKQGRIEFDGKNILSLSDKEMLSIRAKDIRMIFQDPMTSLNPTMKIGSQILEGIINANPRLKKAEAKKIALQMLQNTGISNAKERYGQYPHQFSGGMRQRVMIALAMAVNPELLICDEPTTALDVTLQAQILELIKDLQKKYNTAIILITHDLGVVANIAKNIAVMYAGQVVEYGSANEIFYNCLHPYTWGVLQSVPPLDSDTSIPLISIPGTPPDLFNPPKGCSFAARCPYAMEVCRQIEPVLQTAKDGNHTVMCWIYHKYGHEVINPITKKVASL